MALFAFEQITPEGIAMEFVFCLDDVKKIIEAQSVIADPSSTKNHVQGVIIKTKASYNPNWSYHLDPKSISFFEIQIELCDANVDYIEKNLEYIGGSTLPNNFWCPWTSKLLRQIS